MHWIAFSAGVVLFFIGSALTLYSSVYIRWLRSWEQELQTQQRALTMLYTWAELKGFNNIPQPPGGDNIVEGEITELEA